MARIEKQIVVDAPIKQTYAEWTQFENFPRFMDGVESVTRKDDGVLHWKASIAGKTEEWDARVTQMQPDTCIAWNSTSGARNDGNVSFIPEGEARTRIELAMEYEPDGAVESVGDLLGLVERRVEGDLERFKEFIER